ncbi:hypothetical protein D5086_017758 [Populus alba]|uniref:Uncharacterized protein n=1 Tax=Populus alba TaxID=43335 RepID=A0ACC4BMV6_POPAL
MKRLEMSDKKVPSFLLVIGSQLVADEAAQPSWDRCGLHYLVGHGETDLLPWINYSFGEAAAPKLQTSGAGASKPWALVRQVGLQAPG